VPQSCATEPKDGSAIDSGANRVSGDCFVKYAVEVAVMTCFIALAASPVKKAVPDSSTWSVSMGSASGIQDWLPVLRLSEVSEGSGGGGGGAFPSQEGIDVTSGIAK